MNTQPHDRSDNNPSDPDRLIDTILDDPGSPAAAAARARLSGTPDGRLLLAMDEHLRELPEPSNAPNVAPAVMQRLAADSRSVFRPVRAAPVAPAIAASTRAQPPESALRRWWSRLAPALLPVGLAATAVVLALALGSGDRGGSISGAAVGTGGLWLPATLLAIAAVAIWVLWWRRR